MRERTARLGPGMAGDRFGAEVLEATLARRLAQLADDPEVPLFFGRIDHTAASGGETFHVGRRHVSDPAGDPMVVDWRAPVSVPFYRASRAEPMGLAARRRYGFARGVLTGYEDEAITMPTATPPGESAPPGITSPDADAPAHSTILEAEIERPRTGPMRDIVATIQPEQDVIVRAGLDRTVVVQGAPGTGKTAVGLHRAAYLLYAHREQVTRRGMLVVGPNRSFLRYIRDVLPALGEIDATQTTVPELVAGHGRLRGDEPAAVATLKGDARMAGVLRRALWSHLVEPSEPLVLPRGSRRWRVAAHAAREAMVQVVGRDPRYDAGREQLRHTLAHRILLQIEASGDALDETAWDRIARTPAVRNYVAELWPVVTPAKLLHRLLSDADFLAAAAGDDLTAAEREALLWDRPPRTPGAARWTLADLVLLDEIADLLDRTTPLAHIVADEAQDLSAMMLRALGRRARTGSLTVLGDLAQATTPWASTSWTEALEHLGRPDGHVEELTAGFRVPGDVIDFAARLLPHVAPDLAPPVAVRRSRGRLTLTTEELGPIVAGLAGAEGSVGVIVPDGGLAAARGDLTGAGLAFAVVGEEPADDDVPPAGPGGAADDRTEFDAHVDLVPASLAKGLEFDHVVVADPAGIVAGEPDRTTGLRRLYVCLTRAVTSLVVRHDGTLPPELGTGD
ncbi:AAA family ATPase [Myceligenerans sp. TRM 65318]|uniref:AAA family ATPase n=2 Tax=Myceligenerans pegani TaxID=2776917 RepID=A0ABR9N3D1_9MICO|nr:AAA family ATPase [Myceligenerans sp. TRM 65318]MBE3020429.1 AAA family ATPase [Myceligenerans sp. TRM 65318]